MNDRDRDRMMMQKMFGTKNKYTKARAQSEVDEWSAITDKALTVLHEGQDLSSLYEDMLVWMGELDKKRKVDEKLIRNIEQKFMGAKDISMDKRNKYVTFIVGNISLSTEDKGKTFGITEIKGKFTPKELKSILMWATLEEASK